MIRPILLKINSLGWVLCLTALGVLGQCRKHPFSKFQSPDAGKYLHLKGHVNQQPATMDLIKNSEKADESEPDIYGFFYYDEAEAPTYIAGDWQPDLKSYKLSMFHNPEDDADASYWESFTGDFLKGNAFVGTFQRSAVMDGVPFELKAKRMDGSVAFDRNAFTDTLARFDDSLAQTTGMPLQLKLVRDETDGRYPDACMKMIFLEPENSDDGLYRFLKREIYKAMLFDSTPLPAESTPTEQYFETNKRNFYEYAKSELAAEWGVKDTRLARMYHYWVVRNMSVVYNEKNCLSLRFLKEDGHYKRSQPIYQMMSFDLKNRKILTTNDLFKPNFQKELRSIFEKSIYRQLNVRPDASANAKKEAQQLVQMMDIFDKKHDDYGSFAVTPKGVLFNSNPLKYDEHFWFLSFEEMKPVLNPDFKF
jgi:hypothetical protein